MSGIERRLGDEPGDNAVTPEKLEDFIQFTNDNSENCLKHRLGKELEFMERNGFDSHRLLPLVLNQAKEVGSPVLASLTGFRGLSDNADERESQFVRALHLQLRDHFRIQFGRPVLSAEARRIWPAPIVKPPGFPRPHTTRPGERITDIHTLTEEEAKRTAEYMKQNFPDIVRYYRATVSLSEKQGYVGSDCISRTGLVEQTARASAGVILDKEHIYDVELVKADLRKSYN